MKKTLLSLFYSLLSLSIFSSCGYKLAPQALTEYSEIKGSIKPSDCRFVINIRNKTFVLGLEDRMRFVLTEELIKRGCSLMAKAESETKQFHIEGVVADVSMNIVAEKSGQIALYEIVIRVDFEITSPDGKLISKHFSSPFISDFRSGARIEEIISARDREIEKVLRDIAIEIIEELK